MCIRDSRYGARPLRLAMLQAHYRSLMELSDETMAGASGGIERIDAFFRRMHAAQITAGTADEGTKKRFSEAMDNDLGTPDAVAVVFESINAGNALLDSQDLGGAGSSLATVTELLEVLGLSQVKKDSNVEIEELIHRRKVARQEKFFRGTISVTPEAASPNPDQGEMSKLWEEKSKSGQRRHKFNMHRGLDGFSSFYGKRNG